MDNPHTVEPNSLKAYRYSVFCLGQELWQETNQLRRMNIALQLADAATHLARMEAEELQKQHDSEFNNLLKEGEFQNVNLDKALEQ